MYFFAKGIIITNKKTIIQIVLSEKYTKKLEYIAKEEERSKSNQGARIIERFIDEYEEKHGEINP